MDGNTNCISQDIMIPIDSPSTHPDNIPAPSSVASCCDTLRKETCQICETVNDGIRKNPIASVVGAAFVGAAVCYLILEGRNEPTFRDRYVSGPLSDATDSVNDSLRSIFETLKFW